MSSSEEQIQSLAGSFASHARSAVYCDLQLWPVPVLKVDWEMQSSWQVVS